MILENEISIYDFVCSISEGVDSVNPGLDSHHKKVACIAYNIAMEMNLPNDDIQDILLAAMMHDIGAFSSEEQIQIQTFLSHDNRLNKYTELEYNLMKNCEPLAKAAALIRCYHTGFDESNPDIPIGSYIIHLADKSSILFDEHRDTLSQVPEVFTKISQKQDMFHPDAFAAFGRLIKKAQKRPWNINIIKDEIATLGKDFVLQL